MKENRLKRLLKEKKPAYGVWSGFGSAAVVEAICQLDVDWILLDAEHGVGSFEECFPLLQAIGGSPVTPLVRVPSSDPTAMKRVLDMGAEGVLVPLVESAAEVERVVLACKYPPTGTRGIGPYRASRYYLEFQDYFARANDEVTVVVQIETAGALENLEAILGVPGVDAVFIGPADLSAALGHFPAVDGSEMNQVVRTILTACQEADVPAGYYCGSGKDARSRVAEGFTMVSVALDFRVLTQGFYRELRDARESGG